MDFSKIKEVFASKGINEFEIYHVEEESTSIETFNGEVDSNVVANKNELYIRGVYNNQISTIYVEKDTDDEIENVANMIIANTSVIESKNPYIIYEGSKEYPTLLEPTHDYDNYSQADLIKICQKLEAYAKDNCEFVTSTSASIKIEDTKISITNSNGLNVSRGGKQAFVVLEANVRKGEDVKSGLAYQNLNNIKDIDQEKLYNDAVIRTVRSLGAKSIPSKQYPVVFENKAALSLISCFLGMFSADNVIKKMSLLASKLGEKVFGDNITIEDDPFFEKSFTKYTFDDEGVASYKKTVVENGVLKTYLHDLSTAKAMNANPTANGFKYGKGAPSNLVFKTSNLSFDEMIKDIKDGVLITAMMGQHAGCNQASGAFNLQASGFKIENGKVTEPVTLIIVSGNIMDVLNNVVAISNDFICERHIGIGSMYINSLNISGK